MAKTFRSIWTVHTIWPMASRYKRSKYSFMSYHCIFTQKALNICSMFSPNISRLIYTVDLMCLIITYYRFYMDLNYQRKCHCTFTPFKFPGNLHCSHQYWNSNAKSLCQDSFQNTIQCNSIMQLYIIIV